MASVVAYVVREIKNRSNSNMDLMVCLVFS